MNILNKIFQNPQDSLSIFTQEEIDLLNFFTKDNEKYYLKSFSKNEEEKLIYSKSKSAPEEIVRQLFVNRLINKYKYPKELIEIEVSVNFGREKKREILLFIKMIKLLLIFLLKLKILKKKMMLNNLKVT